MLNKLLIIDDDLVTIKICELLVANTKFAQEVTKFVNGKEGGDQSIIAENIHTEQIEDNSKPVQIDETEVK